MPSEQEDWFIQSIIASRPGTQVANDYGWSGSGNTLWQGPKHVLDVMYPRQIRWPPANAGVPLVIGFGGLLPMVLSRQRVLPGQRADWRPDQNGIARASPAQESNSDPSEKVENTAIANFNSNGRQQKW